MKAKKKIGIWGQYGDGGAIADGQAVRTTIITNELQNRYGKESIVIVNSNNWKRHPFSFFMKTIGLLVNCEKVIILPADNGFKTVVPILDFFNRFYKRMLLYIVIGGFLPQLLSKNTKYIRMLNKYKSIFVQTPNLKKDLEEIGVCNIKFITNLKSMEARNPQTVRINTAKELRVCTLSRINPDKGIEDAIEAVRLANKELGDNYIHLDIYGIVAREYETRFKELVNNNNEFITYCGVVNYNQTVNVLQNYFALLFPTFYYGEGFSGNVIDAFFSGIPIIATDWRYNRDVIRDGVNGLLVPIKNPAAICNALLRLYSNRSLVVEMSLNNLAEAKQYSADSVLKDLYSDLDQ